MISGGGKKCMTMEKRCPGGHRRTNISHEPALERPFSFFFVFFLLGAGVGII